MIMAKSLRALPERHTHANFAGALQNRIGRDAVDASAGQQDSDRGHNPGEGAGEPCGTARFFHVIIHGRMPYTGMSLSSLVTSRRMRLTRLCESMLDLTVSAMWARTARGYSR